MAEVAERFGRINAAPAYQLVAEAIEREIVNGRVHTGDPLGTEAELVKQFGVNRSTVREGIRMLEQAGLVRRDASRRLVVGLPHYDRMASRMTRALVLREVTFRELWDASLVLEIAAVEQAAAIATPEIVAELEANIARTEAAAGNPALVTELDCQWHCLVCKAAQNRVLELAREPGVMLSLPATEMILATIKEATPRLLVAHRAMTKGIGRHDKEAVRSSMWRHLNDWRKGFEYIGKELDQPIDHIYLQSIAGGEIANRRARMPRGSSADIEMDGR